MVSQDLLLINSTFGIIPALSPLPSLFRVHTWPLLRELIITVIDIILYLDFILSTCDICNNKLITLYAEQ